MSFDPAFLELMPSTMKVYTLSSPLSDGYFLPTYSTAVKTWRCRKVRTQELVKTVAGTEEVATTVAWARSTSTFSASDKITIDGSTQGPLLRVDHLYDEDGLHHSKLWYG